MTAAVATLIPDSAGAAALAANAAAAAVVLGLLVVLFAIRRRWTLVALAAVAALGAAAALAVTAWAATSLPERLTVNVDASGGPDPVIGAAAAFVVAWGLLLLLTLPAVPLRRRPWAAAAMTAPALAPGVAVAVVVEGSLAAVVAGWILGVGWLVAVAAGFRRWRDRRGRRTPAADGPWDFLGAGEDLWAPVPVRLLPAGRWTVLRLVAGAAVITLVLVATGLALMALPADWALARWDTRAPETLAEFRTPSLTFAVSVVSSLSNTYTVILASLTLSVVGVAVVGTWRPAVLIVVTVAGEGALYYVVSRTVGRDRPPTEDTALGLPDATSFPSGHTGAAVALYGAVAVLIIAYARGPARWAALAVPGLVVPAVALARIYQGAHFPTDVLGAMVLATAWVLLCARLLLPPDRREEALSPDDGRHRHAGIARQVQ